MLDRRGGPGWTPRPPGREWRAPTPGPATWRSSARRRRAGLRGDAPDEVPEAWWERPPGLRGEPRVMVDLRWRGLPRAGRGCSSGGPSIISINWTPRPTSTPVARPSPSSGRCSPAVCRESWVSARRGFSPMPSGDRGLSGAAPMNEFEASLRRRTNHHVNLLQYRFDPHTPLGDDGHAGPGSPRGGARPATSATWNGTPARSGSPRAHGQAIHLEPATVLASLARAGGGGLPPLRPGRTSPRSSLTLAQGILAGKYLPGQPAARGYAPTPRWAAS